MSLDNNLPHSRLQNHPLTMSAHPYRKINRKKPKIMYEDDIEAAPYLNIITVDTIDSKTGKKTTREVKENMFPTASTSHAEPQGGNSTGLDQADDVGMDIPMMDEMPNPHSRPRKVSGLTSHVSKSLK